MANERSVLILPTSIGSLLTFLTIYVGADSDRAISSCFKTWLQIANCNKNIVFPLEYAKVPNSNAAHPSPSAWIKISFHVLSIWNLLYQAYDYKIDEEYWNDILNRFVFTVNTPSQDFNCFNIKSFNPLFSFS